MRELLTSLSLLLLLSSNFNLSITIYSIIELEPELKKSDVTSAAGGERRTILRQFFFLLPRTNETANSLVLLNIFLKKEMVLLNSIRPVPAY